MIQETIIIQAPIQQQGYPQQGGYPPQYLPQQGGYPPQQYPPQQYPVQQYPPQQYPVQQYPPQQYPPQQYPPQQYPPQQYPPQQGAYPTAQSPTLKKGYDRLVERDAIFIKQEFNILENMTGCTVPHVFNVYPLGKDGDKKGKKLFKGTELSGCCNRQCLPNDCRPFKFKINLSDASEQLDNEPFLMLDRPCKCTCYCCNRPELVINYVEDGKDQYLGKVVDEWACANLIYNVYDSDNNMKFKIEASCCQCGLHMKAPCDACQTIDFEIKSPSGEVISTLQKRSQGCVQAMVNDVSNFVLNFPANCTKEDKALLLSAVILIDYRHFDEKPNGNGQ